MFRSSLLILAFAIFQLAQSSPANEPRAPIAPNNVAQNGDTPKVDDADQILLNLITTESGFSEKAFTRGEYKHIRAAFTKYFELRHKAGMVAALGEDADAVFAWLDKNLEVKETLFTAINPDVEEPGKVMRVFRELWKADPDAVKKHDELATAISVVWDDPRAVYDYRGHQVRTKSVLPDDVMKVGALDNFKYILDRQAKLKGPQLQLPWEFQVHVVNHRTPTNERDWAVTKYLKQRAGVGTIYKEIEYDTVMLQTQSRVCKLNEKPYTLPSIREHGGVCAMQADFAARVGKSLGVPAEYVGGEGNSGGLHAWVMWVEVKAVNKDTVTFTLESFGRYNIDHYYVGTLKDPQSGKQVTDRELERRLTAVGNAPLSSRHANLLMRAYPIIRDAKQYNTRQQLAYLNKVLAVYPMCGEAWIELAALHKDGKLTDAQEATRLIDRATTVFLKFPDFSWKLVDDLITPQKDKQYRTRTFEKLATSYEQLGRPDLACEARLKLVEYQTDAKDHKKAFDGLAFTVRKFPDEGRYVPKMVAKMQDVSKDIKGGDALMTKFWLEILPKVPARRGDEVSEYCVKIHQQAIAYLKENNKPKEAAVVEQSLAKVKSGR
jgi:tetratricopeptide (TPR) repeat protein